VNGMECQPVAGEAMATVAALLTVTVAWLGLREDRGGLPQEGAPRMVLVLSGAGAP
jgi:hypothetical protein